MEKSIRKYWPIFVLPTMLLIVAIIMLGKKRICREEGMNNA